MFVDINHECKYVDIWLANSDIEPKNLITDIVNQYPKYDIIVWRSGTRDLAKLTCELLSNNL